MTRSSPQAVFIGSVGERLFAVLHQPQRAAARGCILIVPPFAEEMNKSRRLATQTAKCLVDSGFAVLLVDLFGTGDSEGEFVQATWSRWVSDILQAAAWCQEQGLPVVGLIGIRLGCCLALEAALKLEYRLQHVLFWQPMLDGARALEQFLRLRLAASLFDSGKKETVKELRGRLVAGETIEVAGYEISSALARELLDVSFSEGIALSAAAIEWIDVVPEPKEPPDPTTRAMSAFQTAGVPVRYHQVIGAPFWSSTEIVVLPALSTMTTGLFCEA